MKLPSIGQVMNHTPGLSMSSLARMPRANWRGMRSGGCRGLGWRDEVTAHRASDTNRNRRDEPLCRVCQGHTVALPPTQLTVAPVEIASEHQAEPLQMQRWGVAPAFIAIAPT